ncbi:MAG: pyrroline-5-carboxylate reductase [Clostridiales bacterium]|nr:pyrroline-5-carboxylate reductase [Clostridiales bacterium]
MKIGFIGSGNMGGAIIKGAIKMKATSPEEIMIYDKDHVMAEALSKELGVQLAQDNTELATLCDCIFIAVKPIFVQEVIDEIKPWLQGKCLISIAAGWTFEMLKNACVPFDDQSAILRVMPNTSISIGQGATILCQEHSLTAGMLTWATGFFSTLGYVSMLPERLLNAATAVSGSGPAYAYLLMESMIDGALRLGLPRETARRLVAQTLIGTGRMVMISGKEPATLKNEVTSPGGSTIEALYTFERNAFKGIVMEAMEECENKLVQMEKKTQN